MKEAIAYNAQIVNHFINHLNKELKQRKKKCANKVSLKGNNGEIAIIMDTVQQLCDCTEHSRILSQKTY